MPEDPLTNLPPVPPTMPPPVPPGDPGRHATYQPVEPKPVNPDGTELPPVEVLTDRPSTSPPLRGAPVVKVNAGMPASHASVAAVGQDVADIDSRVAALEGQSHPSSRELLIVGVLAVLALAVAIVGLVFALGARNTLDQLGARQVTSDVRHAQTEDMLQSSQCTTLAALRGTNSTAGRNAWPGGGGSYDSYFASLAKASASAGCS